MSAPAAQAGSDMGKSGKVSVSTGGAANCAQRCWSQQDWAGICMCRSFVTLTRAGFVSCRDWKPKWNDFQKNWEVRWSEIFFFKEIREMERNSQGRLSLRACSPSPSYFCPLPHFFPFSLFSPHALCPFPPFSWDERNRCFFVSWWEWPRRGALRWWEWLGVGDPGGHRLGQEHEQFPHSIRGEGQVEIKRQAGWVDGLIIFWLLFPVKRRWEGGWGKGLWS